MIYAGILAAGLGVRMHRTDLPKQFLPLGEKPIILHTLEQFFLNPRVGKIVVAAPDTWKLYTEDMVARCDTMGKAVYVISGGASKPESIRLLAQYIENTWGLAADDVLIAHDAIRPFITQRIIDDNIHAAQHYGAANTVMPTNDTIIVSLDRQSLSEIPPREQMFGEQTPQTYMLPRLKEMFQRVEAGELSLQGEPELPGLYIKSGQTMRLVSGEYSNMKIITPYDLEVAQALLKERKL
jgi:2-C-methyl-D-erythritol 4-phosphate cytidylyltransferase